MEFSTENYNTESTSDHQNSVVKVVFKTWQSCDVHASTSLYSGGLEEQLLVASRGKAPGHGVQWKPRWSWWHFNIWHYEQDWNWKDKFKEMSNGEIGAGAAAELNDA